jgi:hypothetical protein
MNTSCGVAPAVYAELVCAHEFEMQWNLPGLSLLLERIHFVLL